MRLLLDTHILIWIALAPERIPQQHWKLFQDPKHELAFSVSALWEIAMKEGTKRSLNLDLRVLRSRLFADGYEEIPITAEHALAVAKLPRLHGDPFDRILIAQAQMEDRTLVTGNEQVLRYPNVRTLAL